VSVVFAILKKSEMAHTILVKFLISEFIKIH